MTDSRSVVVVDAPPDMQAWVDRWTGVAGHDTAAARPPLVWTVAGLVAAVERTFVAVDPEGTVLPGQPMPVLRWSVAQMGLPLLADDLGQFGGTVEPFDETLQLPHRGSSLHNVWHAMFG